MTPPAWSALGVALVGAALVICGVEARHRGLIVAGGAASGLAVILAVVGLIADRRGRP